MPPSLSSPTLSRPLLSSDQITILLRRLGPWSTAALQNVQIILNDNGRLVVTIPVDTTLTNATGNLHGGAIATMIGCLTTAVIFSVNHSPSVTVDLYVSCVAAAPVGSTVTVDSRVEHLGKSMIFSSCKIYSSTDTHNTAGAEGWGLLVATGSHTKKIVGAKVRPSELISWVSPEPRLQSKL